MLIFLSRSVTDYQCRLESETDWVDVVVIDKLTCLLKAIKGRTSVRLYSKNFANPTNYQGRLSRYTVR